MERKEAPRLISRQPQLKPGPRRCIEFQIGTAIYQASNMPQQQPRGTAIRRIRRQLPQAGARKITYGLFSRDGSMMMKP
jgi:hypothetical protein